MALRSSIKRRTPPRNWLPIRAHVISRTTLGLLLAVVLSQPVFASDQPNLILILADDLSATALTCYGGESAKTPVLDQLASGGMRFTHCYSPPLCMPSRTELLTGKYSHRNYVGRGHLAVGESNIASELKKSGYATCQIEKWHLNIRNGSMPPDACFDEYYHTKLAHNYFDPVVNVNGETRTFKGEYGPHVCQDFAFDFIRRNREKPFFLYYAMHLPHAPYHVPPGRDLGERPTKSTMYLAMIEHQDVLIGKLLEHLKSLDLRERTLILFVGDNGTPKGIHYRANGRVVEGGKGTMLDSGTHVPMIANWPGNVPAGKTNNNLIDFADVLPTAMELAGSNPKRAKQLDGVSFLQQLRGDTKARARKYAFKFGCQNGGQGAAPQNGYWARTQRWKLYGDGRLFDMSKDSAEQHPADAESTATEHSKARVFLQNALDELGAADAVKQFRRSAKR